MITIGRYSIGLVAWTKSEGVLARTNLPHADAPASPPPTPTRVSSPQMTQPHPNILNHRGVLQQPGRHHLVEEVLGVAASAQRIGIDLEEETDVVAQRRIELSPAEAGASTDISWHSTFHARFGTGWAYWFGLGRFIRRCVRGLAAEAGKPESVLG